MDWGDVLEQLGNQDLEQVLTYNRDSIVALSLHFIDCIKKSQRIYTIR